MDYHYFTVLTLIKSATMKCSGSFYCCAKVFYTQVEFPGKIPSRETADKELQSHKMGLVEGMFFTAQLQISQTAQM